MGPNFFQTIIGQKFVSQLIREFDRLNCNLEKLNSLMEDKNRSDDGIIDNLTSSIDSVRNEMEIAASELEFEKAAYLRDRLLELESMRD